MLKLLKYIIEIPYKLRRFDQVLEEHQNLKLKQEKTLQALKLEKLEKEKILRTQSRIADNLTTSLQNNQELARRLIQAQSCFQADKILNSHQNSSDNDLDTIERILVEFNSTEKSINSR